MENNQTAVQEINALEAEAMRALQAGREQAALDFWGRILAIDPNHGRTLTAIGQHAFRKGNLDAARTAFQRVVDTDGSDPQQWVSLALVFQNLKDEEGEERAIGLALKTDPSDLLALLMRGNLLERQGKTHQAAQAYGAAATVSPPAERLDPSLIAAVTHAATYRNQYDAECGKFLEAYLDPVYQAHSGENLKRFRDSLDIMLGRKRRYDSLSMMHHYPGLAPIEFFERADFSVARCIRGRHRRDPRRIPAVLAMEEGFTPYITYPDDVPLNQWAELNNSPRLERVSSLQDGKTG